MDKKKITIIAIVILIVVVCLGVIIFTGGEEPPVNNVTNNNSSTGELTGKAPSKIEDDEKDVTKAMREELYNFIPKIYYEEIAPFSSFFIMDATLQKMMDEEDFDYSEANVNKYVKKIFGKDAKINTKEVTEPDVSKSIFYYDEESKSYSVIPLGYVGIFSKQILMNATETKDYYYVYTYMLSGVYNYDEDSVVTDEYGDIDFENTKVQVIIGDKNGHDLVHVFDNYEDMEKEEIWINDHRDEMPVLRYTLKKDGKSYYLIEVEQINY